jgi:diguanylate cyclase (GGDEF)-like protein
MFVLLNHLRSLPKNIAVTIIALSTITLSAIDYYSGHEVAFSVFYLLPVSFIAHIYGRAAGLLASIFYAALWQVINLYSGETFSNTWIAMWNAFTRFGFFAFTTVILCDLNSALREEERLSQVDSLTGALNRRSFYNEMNREMHRSKRYARQMTIVCLDLDNFKAVNDIQGHMAGDEVLKSVADSLKGSLRIIDKIARLGGDEFAILLPETDEKGAKILLPRIYKIIIEQMQAANNNITISIGCLTCVNCTDIEDIIKEADKLMYEAKRSGKNMIKYGSYSGQRIKNDAAEQVKVAL